MSSLTEVSDEGIGKMTVALRDGLLQAVDNVCGSVSVIELHDELEVELPLPERPTEDEDDEEEDPGVLGRDPWCVLSYYGGASTLDEKELLDLIGPDEDGGLVWTVTLVAKETHVKPRRGMPFPVATEDFLSSIRRVGRPSIEVEADAGYDDLWERDTRHDSIDVKQSGARWIFKGVLNGWPGLTLLEVRTVRVSEPESILTKMWSTARTSGKGRRIWDADTYGNDRGVDLIDTINSFKGSKNSSLLVELRAPSWSAQGWSKNSPGFVFWTEGPTVAGRTSGTATDLTMNYGTDIIKTTTEKRDPACTMIHMISHRYASPEKPESARDKLVYHSLALLEWDHEQYCSVVEIGFLNGLSGYKGKSNWVEDKDAKPYSQLYAAFPPEMVLPWKSTLSEIRITNVPYKNKDDFIQNYMNKYEGHQGRFVDINCSFSHDVRLSYNSRSNIATYLVNYILRDKTYSEMKRNCQTFAADLCGFLAGKRTVSPYHPVNQIQYHNSTHTFLYESSKYSTKKKKSMSFLI